LAGDGSRAARRRALSVDRGKTAKEFR